MGRPNPCPPLRPTSARAPRGNSATPENDQYQQMGRAGPAAGLPQGRPDSISSWSVDMTRRLCWLVIAAVAVLGGYGAILAVYPEARPWRTGVVPEEARSSDPAGERVSPPSQFQEKPVAAGQPATIERRPTADKPTAAHNPPPLDRPAATDRPSPLHTQAALAQPGSAEISATILIPPADEVGPLRGCPKKQIEAILGVTISQPHGLGIGAVVPDGPADKAGIRPGDQLARPSECPSKTINRFLPRADSRTVSVTIRRPVSDQAEGEPDREAASDAEDEAAEAPPGDRPSP